MSEQDGSGTGKTPEEQERCVAGLRERKSGPSSHSSVNLVGGDKEEEVGGIQPHASRGPL